MSCTSHCQQDCRFKIMELLQLIISTSLTPTIHESQPPFNHWLLSFQTVTLNKCTEVSPTFPNVTSQTMTKDKVKFKVLIPSPMKITGLQTSSFPHAGNTEKQRVQGFLSQQVGRWQHPAQHPLNHWWSLPTDSPQILPSRFQTQEE